MSYLTLYKSVWALNVQQNSKFNLNNSILWPKKRRLRKALKGCIWSYIFNISSLFIFFSNSAPQNSSKLKMAISQPFIVRMDWNFAWLLTFADGLMKFENKKLSLPVLFGSHSQPLLKILRGIRLMNYDFVKQKKKKFIIREKNIKKVSEILHKIWNNEKSWKNGKNGKTGKNGKQEKSKSKHSRHMI